MSVTNGHFGGESVIYYDPFKEMDLRPEMTTKMFDKALEIQKQSIDTQTGGAGTAGTALIPIWVDPNVVNRTRRLTPLTELIMRRATRGLTYDFIPLTAKAGAAWNFEDSSQPDQVDTYSRVSIGIKFLYAVGRVTGPSISAMSGFIDHLQL